MSDLAITARCWRDLEELAEQFSPDVAEHVIDVFVARRGTDPESGETMSGIGGPLRKLHADLSGGRSIRAVTWYDRGRDVCWLLAAGTHEVYERVEQLARADARLPTEADVANFEADAPVRLIERVVRNAKAALQRTVDHPGTEVAVTESPPPKAYFRVEDDRLWVRVVLYEGGRAQLTTKNSRPSGQPSSATLLYRRSIRRMAASGTPSISLGLSPRWIAGRHRCTLPHQKP